jgi:hypothetical protein
LKHQRVPALLSDIKDNDEQDKCQLDKMIEIASFFLTGEIS